MAKQQAKAAAPAKTSTKTISRSKRTGSARKCLPKALKVMFHGSTRSEFRSILKTWQDSRKKSKEPAV